MGSDVGGLKDRFKKRSLGREDLADEVARRLGDSGRGDLSIARALVVVSEVFEVMQTALEAGKRIEIRGFGTLETKRRNSRRTYCPKNQKYKRVDARWVVVFRTSPLVKRSLMEHLEN